MPWTRPQAGPTISLFMSPVARNVLVSILVVSCVTAAVVAIDFSPPPSAPAQKAATPARSAVCDRPYSDASPWNTRIGSAPRYHPATSFHVGALKGTLTSDPTQYTYPVYRVNRSTPLVGVSISGWYSNVVKGGRTLQNQRRGAVRVPMPEGGRAAAGKDAQIILLDEESGDEWGLSHLQQEESGGWTAWNVYHYNVKWDAVPPRDAAGRPFFPRGAGVPYLAGLVRPCEIERGRIDHALAFAYKSPSSSHVHPATKSDGIGEDPADMPEGARLQLDPSYTVEQIKSWGCAGTCLTVARALQEYGMYIIDNAGRPKVMFEYEATARWNGAVTAETVAAIPLDGFRLLDG